jgi:phenylacetate-coenzyme A ligase PaaK-like adenylate-forming protein
VSFLRQWGSGRTGRTLLQVVRESKAKRQTTSRVLRAHLRHIDESASHCELLIHSGLLFEECDGEIVVSSVANRAYTLLRYRTGDIGLVVTGRCKCGRIGKYITALRGRQILTFKFSDGPIFDPLRLNRVLFYKFPIREFTIIQPQLIQFS